MEEWSKNFFEVLETAVSEVDLFFKDMTEEFAEMLDTLAKFSEDLTVQVQTNFINELDECLNDLIEPIIEVCRDFDAETDEIDWSLVGYVEPSAVQHPACRGCCHYHGQVYGGNVLICGMHPYGVESESCPDWEGENNSESRF